VSFVGVKAPAAANTRTASRKAAADAATFLRPVRRRLQMSLPRLNERKAEHR